MKKEIKESDIDRLVKKTLNESWMDFLHQNHVEAACEECEANGCECSASRHERDRWGAWTFQVNCYGLTDGCGYYDRIASPTDDTELKSRNIDITGDRLTKTTVNENKVGMLLEERTCGEKFRACSDEGQETVWGSDYVAMGWGPNSNSEEFRNGMYQHHISYNCAPAYKACKARGGSTTVDDVELEPETHIADLNESQYGSSYMAKKQDLQEQLPGQTGAKVCAVICDPAPGQGPQGEHCDGNYIRICNTWTSGCQTPVVGDYMLSHSNMGTTSWRVTKITKYGYPNGKRQRYPTCTYTNVGCTDKNACNYSAGFTQKCNGDNSCCIYEACGDPNASNYYAGLTNSCKCTDTTGNGYPDCCQYQGCTNPQAPNYMSHATNDDGSCQVPTKYSCSDGQCFLDFNGQYNTEQDCLIQCSGCAGPECFYCPGPTKTWSPPTDQGCTTIGSQWSQALANGITLYTSMTDCESAESNCSSPDPSDFTTCHCCDGQGNVQVMPGQYAVGKCSSIHNIGASLNPNGWISHQWYNCKSVSEPISCGDNKQLDCYKCKNGEPVMNKFNMSDTVSGCPSGWTTSKNPCKTNKGGGKPIISKKENIREDIDRMMGLIGY